MTVFLCVLVVCLLASLFFMIEFVPVSVFLFLNSFVFGCLCFIVLC